MEIIAAAFAPCLLLWIVARRSGTEFRRASNAFILLTVLWFAPCWLFNRSPVSFDYLATEPPWKVLVPDGTLVRNPLLNDIPLQILPWREAGRIAINSGDLPLLNRFSGAGSVLWENPQACVLYPVQLLGHFFTSFAFPLFSATTKLLLALCGTFLFLRALRNSFGAAIFGAIAYAFGCFTVAYLLFPVSNVTVLLPLLLWLLLLIAREGAEEGKRGTGEQGKDLSPLLLLSSSPLLSGWAATVGASLMLGAMLLGGHPESVLHASMVAIPLAIRWTLTSGRSRGSLLFRYGLIAVLGFALAAPVILPFLSYVPFSQRVVDIRERPGFLSTPSFEPASFVPFVIPNYFGNPRVHNYRHSYNFNDLATQYAGLATLALALAALWIEPRRHALELALLIAATLLAIAPLAVQEIVSSIPLLNLTAHSKLRFVIAFLLVILAARGFDLLVAMIRPRVFLAIGAALFVLVSAIALISYPVFAEVGIRRLIFFTEIAALLSVAWIARAAVGRRPMADPVSKTKEKRSAIGRRPTVILCGLLFLDLFSVMGFYNPAVSRDFYYPLTPAIAAMKSSAPPSRFLGVGLSLMPNSSVFHQLEDVRVHDPLAFHPYVQFLEKAGMDRTGYFAQFRQPPPQNFLDFLGIRSVVRGPDSAVVLNQGAGPRYFIPQQVLASPSPADAFLKASSALTAYAPHNAASSPATIHLVRYEPRRSRIKVSAVAETTVASSEVALPGWHLRRDGKPWPAFVINGAFLAWSAPPGDSTFDLIYRPPGLVRGSILAGAALLVLGILVVASRTKTRRPGKAGSSEGSMLP